MSRIVIRKNTYVTIMGLFMVFAYAAVGALLLFNANFAERFTGSIRYAFSVLLIAYSAFRAYRVIRSIKEENEKV